MLCLINRQGYLFQNVNRYKKCGKVIKYGMVWYGIMRPDAEGRLDRYRIGIPRELSKIRIQSWRSEVSLTLYDPGGGGEL